MSRATGRGLSTGAAYSASSQVVAVIALALTNVIVARTLGPTGTGQFNVMVTVVLFAIVLAPCGLDYGITYFVGARRWAARAALRDAQITAALTTSFAVLILWIVPPVLVDDVYGDVGSTTALIALMSIPFAVSWVLSAAVALAVTDYRTYAIAPVAQAVGMCLLTTSGALLFEIEGAALGLTASHALAALLTWRSLRASGALAGESGGRDWGKVKRAARYGAPVSVANGLGLINRRADLLIVAAVLGATKAGPYAVALAISSVQVMAPRGLATVVLPRVAHDTHAAPEAQGILAQSSRHAVILSCAAGLAVVVTTPLIPLVYGSDFQPAVELTLLLVPGSVAFGIAAVLTAGMIGQGKSLFPLVSALITAPATLAAYLLATHAFGTTGTAVASSVSYGVTGLIAVGYCLHTGRTPARDLLLPRREDWGAYRQLLSRISGVLPRKA